MAERKPDSGLQETLEDRDPRNLNQHVQVVWDEIVGEPDGVRGPECAWRVSHVCYGHARHACYTLLAVLVAPPCALLLGCSFACLAFSQIWCSTPGLRCLKICCSSCRGAVQACLAATLAPVMEATGHLFRQIRINHRQDAPDDRDVLLV
ncbi:caveolin-3-like [Battus philenor]|uniref:caveolin-3-like n=1 Tax=Battus philenor TaxID=42288 RepID=UPI0035D07FE9